MVAMAIHELGTNAVKYGALSLDDGVVRIGWKRKGTAPGGFELEWKETGGPAVQAPSRQGFGSRLIRQALASAIAGEARVDFEPDGVRCTISGRSQD
jgi:two-component sensor histidine kinase